MTAVSFVKSTENYTRFHWSPSPGKPRMTPVSFVKSTESYEVCRGIIRSFLVGLPSGKNIYRNRAKREGLITASDKTAMAVRSCSSWYSKLVGRPGMKASSLKVEKF